MSAIKFTVEFDFTGGVGFPSSMTSAAVEFSHNGGFAPLVDFTMNGNAFTFTPLSPNYHYSIAVGENFTPADSVFMRVAKSDPAFTGYTFSGTMTTGTGWQPVTQDATYIYMTIKLTGAVSGAVFYADVQFVASTICVHESTRVATPSGELAISEIRAGDRVLDVRGNAIPVLANVNSGSMRDFVRVKRGVHGATADLMIRQGHPILIDRCREVPCEALIDGSAVDQIELAEPARLFTLVTARRTFVAMQGSVFVATWSAADLRAEELSRGLTFSKQ
jgi:hypothetical protein